MFKKLHLQNFQSHEDTDIELSKFTCFVGTTNSGKSALFRAVKFLLFDVFEKSFIRWGQKVCTVSGVFNNVFVSRSRGHDINTLTIGNTTYEKVGSTVKELVAQHLNCFKVKGKNVLMHSQDEPHFVISDSPQIKTFLLHAAFGGHLVSTVLKLVNQDVESFEKRLKQTETNIHQITTEIENLESDIKDYEINLARLQKLSFTISTLRQIYQLQEKIVRLQKNKTLFSKLNDLKFLITLLRKFLSWKKVKENLERLRLEIKQTNKQLEDFRKLHLIKCPNCGVQILR